MGVVFANKVKRRPCCLFLTQASFFTAGQKNFIITIEAKCKRVEFVITDKPRGIWIFYESITEMGPISYFHLLNLRNICKYKKNLNQYEVSKMRNTKLTHKPLSFCLTSS